MDVAAFLAQIEKHHDFVRSGDATQMHSVVHHNAQDLVTLLELALKITAG